jgi:hypothetical protein
VARWRADSTRSGNRFKIEWFNLSTAGENVHRTMHEIWLKPNRRAMGFACVPPSVLGAIGLWMLIFGPQANRYVWRGIGAALVFAAAAILVMLLHQMLRPRIAYRDGHVLFFLRSGTPLEVPAPVVEAFFLGQGPAMLPGNAGSRQETVNLVARLSQRHTEWAQQPVKPSLGHWCDGYVTIRGTWCEPLGPELIRRLNRRLKEVKSAHDDASNT